MTDPNTPPTVAPLLRESPNTDWHKVVAVHDTFMREVRTRAGRVVAVQRRIDEGPGEVESGELIVPVAMGSPESPAWMPTARRAFEAALGPWDELAAQGRAALWPMAEGVISDIPSTLSFLRARSGWGLVLEPAAMMTAGMRPEAEDHVARLAEALAGHGSLRGVVLPKEDDGLRGLIERVLLPRVGAGVWIAEPARQG
ncbi:MAG: hypothetical protein HBSAPP03_00330 [Phycisphaerae bacterium]|nr:MAG: hypothetical protein HBSAPP03_00330 [Phycisphaerae bacterium]